MRKALQPLHFVLPSLLALGHVWLCFQSFKPDGNGWSGFLDFLVDLPISLVLAEVSKVFLFDSFKVFLIGGTVWWFGLGIFISLLIRWVYRLIIRPTPPADARS
jgi:hypothetical protein